MENNCGCHDHDCTHDHETIDITLEDGKEIKCAVIGEYQIEDTSYIALLAEDEEDVYLYKYVEIDEKNIDLVNIESDEEFQLASDAFFELFVNEDEENEE